MRHGLLFERFLSEIRVDGQTEAPDIDVDIEHDRREEVLDYVYEKYNRAQAAITCIVQMYRGPNAIRDSMRAFGYPVEMADKISSEQKSELETKIADVRAALATDDIGRIKSARRANLSRRSWRRRKSYDGGKKACLRPTCREASPPLNVLKTSTHWQSCQRSKR